MIYLKKDGTVKAYYIEACNCILSAKNKTTEITIGRYDDIVETYDCMGIDINNSKSSYDKKILASKISEICNEYGYKTKVWYSFGVSNVEILSTDISEMLKDIYKHLEITSY